jgi:CBS domain-containing protein
LPWSALLEPLPRFLLRVQGLVRAAPIAVTLATPLSVALWKLGLYRVHRVWVVDSSQRPVAVLSLTDVCRILADWATKEDVE